MLGSIPKPCVDSRGAVTFQEAKCQELHSEEIVRTGDRDSPSAAQLQPRPGVGVGRARARAARASLQAQEAELPDVCAEHTGLRVENKNKTSKALTKMKIRPAFEN